MAEGTHVLASQVCQKSSLHNKLHEIWPGIVRELSHSSQVSASHCACVRVRVSVCLSLSLPDAIPGWMPTCQVYRTLFRLHFPECVLSISYLKFQPLEVFLTLPTFFFQINQPFVLSWFLFLKQDFGAGQVSKSTGCSSRTSFPIPIWWFTTIHNSSPRESDALSSLWRCQASI